MNLLQTVHRYKMDNNIRYVLFTRYLVIISLISLIIAGVNAFNRRPLVNVLTAFLVGVLCIFWYVLTKYMNRYHVARISFMTFMTFVYIPFGYWTSPGSASAMMYFVFLSIFMLSFVAKNRYEYLYVLAVIIEALLLLRTEIWYPNHYYVYTDVTYRINDLTMNFFVVAIAVATTIFYVMKEVGKHNEALYVSSITDGLTGLYNRRFFSDFIQTEYNRSSRTKEVFSLILFDMNNFKRVNDVYGHRTGDKVLEDIANIIMDNIRSYDVAARYGGDEFVVILPNTHKKQAMANIERMEAAFDQYAEKYRSVDFSVAYGVEDSQDKDLEELYRIADQLLYKCKVIQKEFK